MMKIGMGLMGTLLKNKSQMRERRSGKCIPEGHVSEDHEGSFLPTRSCNRKIPQGKWIISERGKVEKGTKVSL
ncbi:hypothetical protein TanjilG_09271 [Lupinus angustifolius]|uniref:Uncharacterized protein n=1 Tax=Lupinus angustifolius TaxID=3871 RepID=A0A4P1QXJ3_LUPAN|nr:hypothetical protein TanjilG_09271 [Lupinus angustifolius]